MVEYFQQILKEEAIHLPFPQALPTLGTIPPAIRNNTTEVEELIKRMKSGKATEHRK